MQRLSRIKQTSILKAITCLLFLFCSMWRPAFGAQLINNIPVVLENNWDVCLHFESSSSECNQINLPESVQRLPSSATHQTYSKEFVISSELKSEPLGLWFRTIDDVDRVIINDQQIGSTGKFPPPNFESAFRHQRVYFIPSEVIRYNQFNRIEVHTFSSRSRTGIQTEAPMIGNYVQIQEQIQESDYLYVVVAAVLLMLTVFPIFYFIVLKGNYETLFFIFFLVALATLSLARSQIPVHFELDLSSLFKLEVFMLNASIIAVTLFLFHFFELELRLIYSSGLYLLGIAGLIIIIWPNMIQMRQIVEVNYWLLILVNFLVAGSALIIALHKQRRYTWVMMFTCAAAWVVLCYDSLMMSSSLFEINLVQRPSVVPIFSAITGIIFTLTLTHKYWHFFKGSTYDHLTGTLLRPRIFPTLVRRNAAL